MRFDIATLLVLFGFVSWLIAMAGVAALTSESGVPASATGYAWWTVWFQFFLLVFAVFVDFTGRAVNTARLRTYLMAMVTVQWTSVADNARVGVDSNRLTSGVKHATQCILAGAILVLLGNFLLIIYWGLTEHGTVPVALGKPGPSEKAPPAAPTTTTTTSSPKADNLVQAV